MAFGVAAETELAGACELPLLGESPAIEALRRKAEKVARANIPVLIYGEHGTGKEVLARLIHRLSPWAGGPFVSVNCPALPSSLLESELFGYERGSFTGADSAKPGWVEVASGGVLFLDEIAELELALQPKLLQLLQDGAYFRIGGREEKHAEVRVICATNRRLEEEVQAGRFRADLFYRINVVGLRMPPLRERREDLPGFVEFFLNFYTRKYSRQVKPLSGKLLQLFCMHDWPGNVRELENLVRRYVVVNSEDAIASELRARVETIPLPAPHGGGEALGELTRDAVRAFEKETILRVLQANEWNRRKTARELGISYRALFYKIKEFALQPVKPRAAAAKAG